MKQDFEKWLKLHKGKPLTSEMIKMIAQHHEDEIGNMLYNEGLCLESMDTGKTIQFGTGEEKDWVVESIEWQKLKEFKTLKDAIVHVNRE